nr:WcbI family polysaccharide biosynthesis putative acetyltransferase [Brevundimonas diminuta]
MKNSGVILVSSNCMTAGIALSLKALLPDHEIETAHMRSFLDMSSHEVGQRLAHVDIWVTGVTDQSIVDLGAHIQTIRIPRLIFDAYHPDIAYARDAAGTLIKGAGDSEYHSAIVLWCHQNGVSPQQCTQLFTPETFARIGYVGRWAQAVTNLRALFDVSDLAFDDFFPAMMELSPFMHAFNHPTAPAVTRLAKLVACKITGDRGLLSLPIERSIQDTLALDTIWPIYPGVADHYGLRGAYLWKIGAGLFFRTPADFVDASYAAYKGADSAEWEVSRMDRALFDRVLPERVSLQ